MQWIVVGALVVVAAAACVALAGGWYVTGGSLIVAAGLLQLAARREYKGAGPLWTLHFSIAAFSALSLAVGGAAAYAVRHDDQPHPELAASAALAAAATSIYMSARATASLGCDRSESGAAGVLATASRSDVLLILIGAGSAFGGAYLALWATTAVSAVSIAGRLAVLRLTAGRA